MDINKIDKDLKQTMHNAYIALCKVEKDLNYALFRIQFANAQLDRCVKNLKRK